MPTDMRYIFDTNVIVSALLLKNSVARQAFDRALGQGKLLISQATIEELYNVLRRTDFDKYVHEDERLEFLVVLVHDATMVDITETVSECRDSKDNKFLELAINGNATCIISGDDDLLILHPFRGIPILTPREFLQYAYESAK
jgi:putative PIN family toxin of toxin-antitoxin system